jgi:TRAP-type mannitol/chloroaromatic compound transport system permease small subunit
MIGSIKTLIAAFGQWSAWLNLVLVVLICVDVALRYIFNYSANWVIETEWHLFGLIFLLGSAYTLQEDKHVRVDLYYDTFSDRKKALVDILGAVFFLIPWSITGIVTCYKYASNSFYIREGSPNPDGLPALYIIKYVMVLAFILLLLQALVSISEKVKSLKTG